MDFLIITQFISQRHCLYLLKNTRAIKSTYYIKLDDLRRKDEGLYTVKYYVKSKSMQLKIVRLNTPPIQFPSDPKIPLQSLLHSIVSIPNEILVYG